MAAGREKEGEVASTSLEFEYLHRCEMLIGGDDIRNDVIILGTRAKRKRFRFALIGIQRTKPSGSCTFRCV